MASYLGKSPARLAIVTDDTINSAKIIDNTITSADILNATITGADLASDISITTTGTISMSGGQAIPGKIGGTNFTDSLIIGHSTTGTLNSAERNTGVGVGAMVSLTSGDRNTVMGRNTGRLISSGTDNVLIGTATGQNVSTAEENTIVGTEALTTNSTSGTGNSGFGYQSLKTIGSGDYNIGLGWKSGDALTNGKGNVIIGSNADVPSATGDRQLVIAGYDGTTTTTWISGDSSGKIGFGTTSPSNKLHIYSNDTTTTPQLLIEQDGTGDPVLGFKLTDSSTSFSMGLNNSSGDTFLMSYNGTDIGTNPILAISTTCRIGLIKTAVGSGSAKVQVGDVASFDSNVGIGTTSPGTNLHVIGGIALGTSAISNHSTGDISGVGKLAFGTNNPNSVPRIFKNNNFLNIQEGTSGLKILDPSSNTTVEIDSNQNVGICCNLTVGGNLTINGTTTTLNTATLDVEDKTICIAKGSADAAAANGAGIIVDGASATLLYNSSGDCFAFNKAISVTDGNEVHGLGNKGCQIFFGQSALLNNNQGLGNIALGYEAMKSNVSGCYNTAVGHQALTANVSDAGSYNTAHGYQALYNNTTGEKNTAIGYHSMYANTTGEYNAAIGTDSLRANTTGQQNVALGHNSLYNNTAGFGQVAAGYKSLFNNTTGNYNVALGAYNLEANVSGSCNVAIGYEALQCNTANQNVAVGYQVLKANTTGTSNVAVGFGALKLNTTGHSNVAVGLTALQANTSGQKNIAIGVESLNSNTTGQRNVSIGTTALRANVSGKDNVAIGNAVMYTNTHGCENVALGNYSLYKNTIGNQNIALGTNALICNTTASFNVAVGFHALACNTTGQYNVGIGFCSLNSNTIGQTNVGVGYQTLKCNTTGQRNTAIGDTVLRENTTGEKNTAIGAFALMNNTSGKNNVAIGVSALQSNTIGQQNVALGEDSMANNTTGIRNVALGLYTLGDNTTGSYNIAVGLDTLRKNTVGQFNVGIGYRALFCNTTASYNLAMGYETLELNTTGQFNVALGYHTLKSNVTGGQNVALGSCALFANVSATDNVAIGNQALKSLTGTNTGSNVAIGACAMQTAQGQNNTVVGRCAMPNATSSYNVVMGRQALAASGSVGSYNTALGFQSLCKNTAGSNTAVGGYSGFNNSSGEILAIGYSALCSNTVGTRNISIGSFAMKCNTTGNDNTAIGFKTLFNNTTGIDNVAVGSCTLYLNTIGQRNVAVGYRAMCDNTTGISNVAIGSDSLGNNTIGVKNTVIGDCAMITNTTGERNVAVGSKSLFDNITGSMNVAVGGDTLGNNTAGSSNTAIGVNSMFNNTTGAKNISVGADSLNKNTTGFQNTALGACSMYNNTTGACNVSVGYFSLFSNTTATKVTAIGACSLRLSTGFGNTAVGANALCSNVAGQRNTAIGSDSFLSNQTGDQNTGLGLASMWQSTGSNNVALGYQAGSNTTSGSNKIVIGHTAQPSSATASNEITLGNSSITCFRIPGLNYKIDNGGDVTLPANKKVIFGDAGEFISGNGSSLELTSSANIHLLPATGNRIGIGTNSPNRQVQISETAANCPFIRLETTDGGNKRLDLSVQSSNGVIEARQSAQCLIFDATTALISKVNGAEKMRIDSSGNVGIGTTSMDGILHLDDGTSTSLVIEKDGGGSGSLRFHNSGTSTSYIQLDASEDMVYFGSSGVNQIFYANNSERMRITSEGVSINTTESSAPIDMRLVTATTTQQTDALVIRHNTTQTSAVGFGSRIKFIGERANGTDQVMGHIGFRASTNTSSVLSSDFVVSTATAGSSSEKMRLDNLGSLGLGTTSPFNTRPGSFTISNEAPTIYMEDTNGSGAKVGQLLYQNAELSYTTGSRNGTGTTGSTEHLRISTNGQLLIGTTDTPSSANTKLKVHVPISSSSGDAIHLSHNTNGTDKAGAALGLVIQNGGSSTNAAQLTFKTASGGSLSERMRIGNNGNIGIGTTNTASARLYVSNDTGAVDDNGLYVYSNIGQTVPLVRILQDGAGSNQPAVHVRNDGSAGGIIVEKGTSGATANTGHNQFVADGSGNSGMTILSGTSSNGALCFGDNDNNCIGYINYTHNGDHLDFGVNNAEKMRITSGGVAVTGAVVATVGGTGLKSVGANAQVHADASSGYGALIADGASGNDSHIFFQTAGTDKARLTANNSGSFIFGSGGATERMRITSAGLVGIGTTNPTETFTVNGDVVFNGSAGNKGLALKPSAAGSTTILLNTFPDNSSGRNWAIRNRYNAHGRFEIMRGTTNTDAPLTTAFRIDHNSNAHFAGALSKASGSFQIDHPLESKKDTHNLVHSFVEAPQADNIYRGKVDLVGGTSTVNIDTNSGMSEGTFVLLNREVQVFTSNETGWTAVKGSVSGNTLTITAQDNSCTDTISWLVIGERKDKHMYDTSWTDENGKVIVEPLKETDETI